MKMGMGFFKQLRREFAGYNGKKLSQDLMAGLTVAAVALPALAPHSRLSSILSTAMENAGASRAGTAVQSI